uniref:Uncharacterized protein n=1 Tax=Lepeophtheirus salmonis TaxID=72036 RepID=A0A0K2TQ04_LEPSM
MGNNQAIEVIARWAKFYSRGEFFMEIQSVAITRWSGEVRVFDVEIKYCPKMI